MATIHVDVSLKDVDITVEVDFNPGWHRAGNRRGHPDGWTEDEGEAAEIEKITLTLGSGRVLDVTRRLNRSDLEKIQRACDRWEDEPPEYEPDYDD